MEFNLPLVLTAASVGLSTGLIVYYFGSKKDEEEVVVTAEDIYEYNGMDKIAIDAGGTDVILSITAEEKLRKLLNKSETIMLLRNKRRRLKQRALQAIKYSACMQIQVCLHVAMQKYFMHHVIQRFHLFLPLSSRL